MPHHDDSPEKMAKMNAWLETAAKELGVDRSTLDEAKQPLLDMVSTISHGPSRPGAPLTAFLVGLAAGQGGNAAVLANRLARVAEQQQTHTQN